MGFRAGLVLPILGYGVLALPAPGRRLAGTWRRSDGPGKGCASMDLGEIARRLDRDEVLHLKYLCPLRSNNGGGQKYEERVGQLLDVEVATEKLFVRCKSQVIWITPDEAIGLVEESG